jgi:hypothetical protein
MKTDLKDIKLKQLCDSIQLVNNPELIKVKTIKAKHLAQVNSVSGSSYLEWLSKTDQYEVIGLAQYEVLMLVKKTGQLIKTHQNNYLEFLRNNLIDHFTFSEANKKVLEILNLLPQLFED